MSEQPSRVDLSNCDREPIHVPGAIQPHGVLLALREPSLTVSQVSENVAAHLDKRVEEVLERPLEEVLDARTVAEVRAVLVRKDGHERDPLRLNAGGIAYDGIVHRCGDVALLELERVPPPKPGPDVHRRMQAALDDLQQARTIAALCDSVVRGVRRLTGFERVLVYRFDEDDHGEVIAEAKSDDLEPYLGLHYPASDIPRQARALYRKNWIRLIPDGRYTPARLVPALRPDTGEPLDLSLSVLRSVSPIHLEYMENMGVRASMSISLVVRDRLWGLVGCLEHGGPRFVPYASRSACEVLGRLASLHIAALEDLEATTARSARLGTQQALADAMRESASAGEVLEALSSRPEELLGLVDARGAAVVSNDGLALCGQTPSLDFVRDLSQWLDQHAGLGLFSTASLAALYPEAEEEKTAAAGVLTFALPGEPNRRLLWFRPEMVQTVSWGGDPRKPAEVSDGRLHPRRSFAQWKEEVRLRSLRWSAADREAAQELRRTVVDVDLERQVGRAQQATRARDELVSVVSHDLKTPLHVIRMQADLFLDTATAGGGEPPDWVRQGVSRIHRAVRQMDNLIADLLDVARIEAGRLALERRNTDVVELIHEALLDLRPLADAKRLQLVPDMGELPHIDVDRERVLQVLSNLVGNAIKFTPEGGRVTVTAEVRESEVAVSVADTGVGISPEQLLHVFDRYWQAGRTRRMGTGLGLSIAKGIVEAHGGSIEVESIVGAGTVFTFTLPLVNPDPG